MTKPTFNLLGEIVSDDSMRWFDSDVVPAMVVGWLKNQKGEDVEININSPGGDVTAGLAIANAIKAYDGHVTANVLGIAASMASVIACACDEMKMGDGAFLMIHNPWTFTSGEADDLRHEADVLDKMRDSVIGFYQAKTALSADELKALMDAETWMTFDDMTANGFAVSRYTEEFAAAACATHRAFANAPEAARRFFSSVPGDWQRRFAGLQSAKDKEIAELKARVAEAERRGADLADRLEADYRQKLDAANAERDAIEAKMGELRSSNETLSNDLDAKSQALDAAKADAEQLAARCAETEKALADTQAALAVETERYRAQVGAAMKPQAELPSLEDGLARCATPAEKSAFIASGKFKKK